jgi:16S rRNA (uracil1498-N3)-methyltransferase
VLSRDTSHYLVTVLRLSENADVLLFNDSDGEWKAAIAKADRKAAALVCDVQTRQPQLPPDIDYLFAPLKSARLDYLAQKVTEMGVRRLRPVFTRHTVAGKVNLDRLRSNAVEAAEQCNMVYVPEVLEPAKLPAVLRDWPDGRVLVFCDEAAEKSSPLDTLRDIGPAPLAVLLGPEGGFAPDEREMIRTLPFSVPIGLGPRIMRADTAGVAILALVQAVLGDWS